jgi:hypothetical protein
MPASPAQIAANQKNAQLSTGPRTPEGKAISRGNALKHGLAGEGVVLPADDAADLERLDLELQADLRPSNALARVLVRRVAALAVRMDACARREHFQNAERARNAGAAFDDRRRSDAEHMVAWLATEPATFSRRLQQSPEGLDLMIGRWRALESDLLHPAGIWDMGHYGTALNLTGFRTEEIPRSRLLTLSQVLWGNRSCLTPAESEGKDDLALKIWAREQLARIIAAEIDRLTGLRAAVEESTIARDRAEAPERATFDPSREATLTRKYEAAAERGFFRTLRELREVEAEAAARPEPGPPAESASSGIEVADDAPPGDPARGPGEPRPSDPPTQPSDPRFPAFEEEVARLNADWNPNRT